MTQDYGYNRFSRRCPKRTPVEERILAWVSPEPNSGCWIWMGNLSPEGYGRIGINRRKMYAHRISYECFVGVIPSGLELDHKCRMRCCVNPEHLEPVTHRENGLRGISPLAENARKTSCVNGHAFTPENTHVGKSGRKCKACRAATMKRLRYETRMSRMQG
jgi:HNH endonuclease